jgi:hypothetical protein
MFENGKTPCPPKLCKLCIKVQCSQQTSGNAKLFLPVSKFLPNLYLQVYHHLSKMEFNKRMMMITFSASTSEHMDTTAAVRTKKKVDPLSGMNAV